MTQELRVARTGHDLAQLDNTRAIVVGSYQAIERPVKGGPRAGAPKDHAIVVLDDGVEVFLEPLDSPKSSRSAGEIERFDRRKVRVRGVLHAQMPSTGQSLIAPCVSAVEEVSEE